jgi:sulfite exporter TauE/SafE/copper chaperone CopZ
MLKKIKLQINGIHCKSCKILIETEIDVLPGVNKVEVDYISGEAEIEFDDEKISQEKIFKAIEKLNYKPEINDGKNPPNSLYQGGDNLPNPLYPRPVASGRDRQGGGTKNPLDKGGEGGSLVKSFLFGFLIPVAAILLVGGYIFIQKLGGFELLSKLNEGNVGYGIIFVIGLLAGFHCVGMCGGLVVAYSAPRRDAPRRVSTAPHIQYNTGRLISYTVLGAVLGGVGSFFGISPTFTGTVILIAGIFMVLMGLSFIKDWPILEKVKLRTPQFIARFLYNQKHSENSKGPFMIGLLNGFMPCGPLQAMQLYALTSGSSTRGALSMAIYALGTVPLMFGFGTVISSISQRYIKKIFKFSGALIIILGLFMANRGLANFGYGFNNLTFKDNVAQKEFLVSGEVEEYQVVNMDLTYFGYKPNVLYIKEGIPVRWIINVKQMTGCTDAIMIESLGIKRDLQYGENIIEFTPPDGVREIKFSCWMRMVWGKFVVTKEDVDPTNLDIEREAANLPKGGSCGGGCGCGGGRIKVNR